MNANPHAYPVLIKETYLDSFSHMNNAMYLTLFEEARWDFMTQNGYGLDKIKATGLGPTILQITLKFHKELRHRDAVVIETQMLKYEKKIGILQQQMRRDGVLCCSSEFTIGLFSVQERKLVLPTPDWLQAMGIDPSPT